MYCFFPFVVNSGASGSTTQGLDAATNGPISQTKRALQAHAQAMALCAQSFVYPTQNLLSKYASYAV